MVMTVVVSAGLPHPGQEEAGRDDPGPPEAEKGTGSGNGRHQIGNSLTPLVNKSRKTRLMD